VPLGASRIRPLADHFDRPVRVVLSREDVVRFGPKRPPVGAGMRRDGTGILRLGVSASRPEGPDRDTAGRLIAQAQAGCPGLLVETVTVSGPPVSAAIRGAGWAEAAVLQAAAAALAAGCRKAVVETGDGARAEAMVEVDPGGWPTSVLVEVDAGDALDEVVLRSYVQGAAHMALGWVCSEGIALDEEGRPTDLTIRSFGILRAKDTPPIEVAVRPGHGRPARRASDAVYAAVAAATWLAQGLPSCWPTRRGTRR
jgi:xanthine dehydrogenase small subunit